MAADIQKIIANLLSFHDFSQQTIISVGAGGGQFIEYGRNAREVIAIDNDPDALDKLAVNLKTARLSRKFTLVCTDFCQAKAEGDIVLFEFCLHEMANPEAAISHALKIAPRVLISDHWTDSEWAYIVDEKEKVQKSWKALENFHPRKIQVHEATQFFHDYNELYEKVRIQGDKTIERIQPYREKKNFNIPMTYAFALI